MKAAFGVRDDGQPPYMTVYMGPLDTPSSHWPDPDPAGRLLAGLLRRLGGVDESLAPIGKYFAKVGLFGIGQGPPREWDVSELPPEALSLVV
jgi:hypothetical protein